MIQMEKLVAQVLYKFPECENGELIYWEEDGGSNTIDIKDMSKVDCFNEGADEESIVIRTVPKPTPAYGKFSITLLTRNPNYAQVEMEVGAYVNSSPYNSTRRVWSISAEAHPEDLDDVDMLLDYLYKQL